LHRDALAKARSDQIAFHIDAEVFSAGYFTNKIRLTRAAGYFRYAAPQS
jgi:hypothetical protein